MQERGHEIAHLQEALKPLIAGSKDTKRTELTHLCGAR